MRLVFLGWLLRLGGFLRGLSVLNLLLLVKPLLLLSVLFLELLKLLLMLFLELLLAL